MGGLPRGSASMSAYGGGGVGQIPLLPVNRMTHRCKNITLPQTSFAGGKNSFVIDPVLSSSTKI